MSSFDYHKHKRYEKDFTIRRPSRSHYRAMGAGHESGNSQCYSLKCS